MYTYIACVLLEQKTQSNGPEKEKDGVIQNFKRTLSKKEKKEKKKREKEFSRIPDGEEQALSRDDGCVGAHTHTIKLSFMPHHRSFFLCCYHFFLLCHLYVSLRRDNRLAAEVYKDMPETSFTRTISNPEVVMKRRRQQKLEKRMQEFRSSDGRPDSGTHNFEYLSISCLT